MSGLIGFLRNIKGCLGYLTLTHCVSKVQDDEGAVGHARFAEVRVGFAGQVLVVQLLHPAFIRTLGHLRVTRMRG